MKTNTQLQKIIAVLMIFIIMTEFTGCYSTRILSASEISSSDINVIHVKNSDFPVDSLKVSDGILSARLHIGVKHAADNKSNQTKIYLVGDSATKIADGILSSPVKNITKIEQKIPEPKKTRNLIIGLVAGGLLITASVFTIIALNNLAEETINTINAAGETSTTLCSNW
jgi:hypothetical protein